MVAALVQVPNINTLFPIAFQTKLTSNIGRDIDRISDTKRRVALHLRHAAQLLGEAAECWTEYYVENLEMEVLKTGECTKTLRDKAISL